MRHERAAQVSGVDQMFFEGKRKSFTIRDKATGQTLQSGGSTSDVSWAEVVPGSNVIIARENYGRSSKTYKADEVVATGAVKVSGQK